MTMGLILVASEDSVEVETIKAALSVHGWWVTVASDRESAIQAAADQAPKLVLVDHDLPGSIELVRSFGSTNGGPGVVVCVADDLDNALELKEAGVDELVTKPLSPPALLEVVRRCLTAPRPAEVERPAPAKQLLTTEEIFGDVLRELEDDAAPKAPAAPIAPAAPTAPALPVAPRPTPAVPTPPSMAASTGSSIAPPPSGPAAVTVPAATGDADLLSPPSAERPVVSLAGLFDEEPEELAPAPSPEAAWSGEERRGPERPWDSSAQSERLPALDQLFGESEAPEAPAEPLSTELQDPDPPATSEVDPDASEDTVEFDQPLAPPPSTDETAAAVVPKKPVPRAALWLGALAASLLVAAGVIFIKNPGSESTATPIQAGEPIAGAAEPAEPPVIDQGTVALTEPNAELESSPESPTVAAAPAAADSRSPAPIESLDLEAIVEQELDRREEELRQVFLEEEKRLLRELNKLDEVPPVGEEGATAVDADPSGDGGS